MALIAVSLLCYAALVYIVFVFMLNENILSTERISAVLNPVHMFFVSFIILTILFLDSRGKLLNT